MRCPNCGNSTSGSPAEAAAAGAGTSGSLNDFGALGSDVSDSINSSEKKPARTVVDTRSPPSVVVVAGKSLG